MIAQDVSIAPRITTVLDSFPPGLLPTTSFELLSRFYLTFDTFGRIEAATGEPLIDEHTLDGMLREFVEKPKAIRLIQHLKELPGCAFRPAQKLGPPTVEVPWFRLAEKVVIFDASPGVTYREMKLPPQPNGRDLVSAVYNRFPSMEEELITPDLLPSRIEYLLDNERTLSNVLRMCERQLGWWCAFVAVLLVAPASVARSTPTAADLVPVANAWPLSMYFLAAALGGWTLTVVASCILSPLD